MDELREFARTSRRSLDGVYAPDAIAIYDGNVRKGAAEIQAGAEKELAAKRRTRSISWTTTSVRVAASGDLACETG